MASLHKNYKRILKILDNNPIHGICCCIDRLENAKDREKIKEHFCRNQPSAILYPEFYNHPTYAGGLYWWEAGTEAREQRRLFVLKMLEITKPEPILTSIVKFLGGK